MKTKFIVSIFLAFALFAIVNSIKYSNYTDNDKTSLTMINIMNKAIASCEGSRIEGYVCAKFDNGKYYCQFGGEVGVFCP